MKRSKAATIPDPLLKLSAEIAKRCEALNLPENAIMPIHGRALLKLAINSWERYPEFWWKIHLAGEYCAKIPDRWGVGAGSVFEQLLSMHNRATSLICEFAKICNIDPMPIQVSGELCKRVFLESPPKDLELDRHDLFWPDCLKKVGSCLHDDERRLAYHGGSESARLWQVARENPEAIKHIKGFRGIITKEIEQTPALSKVHKSPLDKLDSPATPLQKAIWKALKNKALKKNELANVVLKGNYSSLYSTNRDNQTGGLKELQDKEIVLHKHTVGYYRPDAPPPNEEE